MLEAQVPIMLFFSNFHGAVPNFLGQLFTILGEQYFLVAFLTFLYLCVDKKKGFCIGVCLLAASVTMNVVKAIIKVPRPWMVIDNLDLVRQKTATGYSFPSGHTTTAAATYSALARAYKKRWLTIICVIVILLVAFSRVFLSVHWPTDVMGGLIIGCGITLLCYGPLYRMTCGGAQAAKPLLILGIIATVFFLVFTLLLSFGLVDELAFSDLSKNIAIAAGSLLGYVWEINTTNFEIEQGCWGKKILRFLIGVVVGVGILGGLKALFVAIGYYPYVIQVLRYFLVGIWLFGLSPMLATKWGLVPRASQQ